MDSTSLIFQDQIYQALFPQRAKAIRIPDDQSRNFYAYELSV